MRYRTSKNANYELYYGRQLDVEEIVRDIDKVTSKEITAIANDVLKTELLSMVVVGPKKELKKSYSLAC
jgi:predicted Zn-dependent peptidase